MAGALARRPRPVLSGRIGSVDDKTGNQYRSPEFAEDDDDTDLTRTTTRSVGQGTAARRSIGAARAGERCRRKDDDPLSTP